MKNSVFPLYLMAVFAVIASPASAGAFSATRTFDPPAYTAGELVKVVLTVNVQTAGEIMAFGIEEDMPSGNVTVDLASVRAVGYDVAPRMVGNVLKVAFLQPPTMPVTITYDALISSGTSGDLTWSDGMALWRLRTPENQVSANLPTSILPQYVIPPIVTHTADQDGNGAIDLDELLRIIQFYNTLAFHCEAGTEDGYKPGLGNVASDYLCTPHNSDYIQQDWDIDLDELLRVIQFYNTGGYDPCPFGEDGFVVAGEICSE